MLGNSRSNIEENYMELKNKKHEKLLSKICQILRMKYQKKYEK